MFDLHCSISIPLVAIVMVTSLSACAISHEMAPISPCGSLTILPEIRWYGPTEPRDRAANEQRCLTVGPPVIMEAPKASFGALGPLDSLAVFSWNMAVGGGDLLSFLKEEVGLTCAGGDTQAGGAFPHFVLLLQEASRRSQDLPPLDDPSLAARKTVHAPRPGGDLDVVDVARRCGLAAFYVPSGRNGVDVPGEDLIDKGNAILSTLPLSDLLAVENPFETERKVAIGATIHTPAPAPLRLVNAHTEVTSTFRRVLLTGNQVRVRQVLGLIDVLEAHEKLGGRRLPTLLGGDFNTWSGGESALKFLRQAFPDSPEWDGKATRGPFPTDHIFFRRGSEGRETGEITTSLVAGSYRATDGAYASDHLARFVKLWFAPEPTGR
jgi:endonuclease/exonuclease/phosphatase family metal-dependent hydrolase